MPAGRPTHLLGDALVFEFDPALCEVLAGVALVALALGAQRGRLGRQVQPPQLAVLLQQMPQLLRLLHEVGDMLTRGSLGRTADVLRPAVRGSYALSSLPVLQ